MTKKSVLIGILLATVLLGIAPALSVATPATSRPAQEEPPPNLLQNPSFEGISCRAGSVPPECLDNWTRDTYTGQSWTEIYTPQGWVTFWREGGDYGRPECLVIPNIPPFTGELPRIRSGHYALKLFSFSRIQDAGYYQRVTGLEPGATVQFSAYGHGWSCDQDEPMGYTCGDPWNQTFQVGIEPNGGTDPFSPSIIWSAKQQAPDHYILIGPVSAQVGEGGAVTVYMRSKTKWAFKHLDAYWDDASLIVTTPGTPPTNTPPPPPTAGPPPTPRATSTPHPDGSVVHPVQPGDTIFGIALMYSVDADQIRQLNAGSVDGDIIHVGQNLVISLPSQAPTPTPPPPPEQPTPDPGSNPTESATGEQAGGASICVLAFHDRNSDKSRDETAEELLPNAQFTLADASGVIAQHTSDGINEPHCFTGLATGAYRVIMSSPPGYAPSGSAERDVAVAEGTSLDLQFGNVRGEDAGNTGETPSATTPNEDENETNGSSPIFSTLAKISGVLVLILAAGMAVLFVVNRQRM